MSAYASCDLLLIYGFFVGILNSLCICSSWGIVFLVRPLASTHRFDFFRRQRTWCCLMVRSTRISFLSAGG